MRASSAANLCAVALALSAACTESAPPSGPVVRVSWAAATGPHAGLPPGVESLHVRILDPDGEPAERSLDLDGASLTDDTPYGVVGDLAVGRPVELRIEAMVGGAIAYTGVVGPVTLRPGERRYVDLLLVPTGASTVVGHLLEPRAMHTATRLADGRILIAGGFRVAAEVSCDAQPAGSRCFDLTASSSAELYEPGSGRTYRVRLPMTAPRAAHTATALPDGRVLFAGGVSAAQLAFVAQPDGGLLPVLRVGENQSQTGTEVFVSERDLEDDDVASDGDPGRGGFVADAPMVVARAQHTATLLPSGGAVLVAGGNGAEDTSELWIDGEWSNGGILTVSRRAHVAVAVPDPPAVWLLAGAIGADEPSDMGEVFTIGNDGVSGSWAPIGGVELLDQATAPGLNLTGAVAVLLAGRTAAVFGWIGPVCDDGGTPAFTGSVCPAENRAYAFDTAALRIAQPIGRAGELHAMGAATARPDGGAWVIGGFSDLTPSTTDAITRLTGQVDVVTEQPEVVTGETLRLTAPRALLAAETQTDGAALVSGGLRLGADGIEMSDVIEIVNAAR